MNKASKQRTFEGWTLVDPRGKFVMCGQEPQLWKLKSDALDCRDGAMRLQRVRVVTVDEPLPLTRNQESGHW